jgi:hypothetical protein
MESQKSLMRCPLCDARYIVVRVEANPTMVDREITCLSCGGPLNGREGKLVLKYFLADSRKQAGKRYGGIRSH